MDIDFPYTSFRKFEPAVASEPFGALLVEGFYRELSRDSSMRDRQSTAYRSPVTMVHLFQYFAFENLMSYAWNTKVQ